MNTNGLTPGQGWGIAILRVVVGIVFLVHGQQKLFTYGFNGVAGLMGQLGIPFPMLSAVVVTLVEFLGGLALILGFFTRWAATLLAINMLVAMAVVHLRVGFFLPNGFEYALTLFAANLALAFAGSGEVALDSAFATRKIQ